MFNGTSNNEKDYNKDVVYVFLIFYMILGVVGLYVFIESYFGYFLDQFFTSSPSRTLILSFALVDFHFIRPF